MTRQNPADNSHGEPVRQQLPRLRLKPKGQKNGFVDGAWWPRSDDLVSEIPGVLAVLADRNGPINRVIFNSGEWSSALRKVVLNGRVVRFDGYKRQPAHTIELQSVGRRRTVLLVVPSSHESAGAQATLLAAAVPGNDSDIAELLATGLPQTGVTVTGLHP